MKCGIQFSFDPIRDFVILQRFFQSFITFQILLSVEFLPFNPFKTSLNFFFSICNPLGCNLNSFIGSFEWESFLLLIIFITQICVMKLRGWFCFNRGGAINNCEKFIHQIKMKRKKSVWKQQQQRWTRARVIKCINEIMKILPRLRCVIGDILSHCVQRSSGRFLCSYFYDFQWKQSGPNCHKMHFYCATIVVKCSV